jgi:hypothetical protein
MAMRDHCSIATEIYNTADEPLTLVFLVSIIGSASKNLNSTNVFVGILSPPIRAMLSISSSY